MRLIHGITLAAAFALSLSSGCGREKPANAPPPPPPLVKPAEQPEHAVTPGQAESHPAAPPVTPAPADSSAKKSGTQGNPSPVSPVIPGKDSSTTAPDQSKPAAAAPSAPPETKPQALASPAMPGIVVFPASLGKVTFNHAGHAKRLACSNCHTTNPPQKIPVSKEIAHQLCIGCHKAKAAGPTQCLVCHIK